MIWSHNEWAILEAFHDLDRWTDELILLIVKCAVSSDVEWSRSLWEVQWFFPFVQFLLGQKESRKIQIVVIAICIDSVIVKFKNGSKKVTTALNAKQSMNLTTDLEQSFVECHVITEVKIKAFQVSLGIVRYFCPVKQIIVTLGQQLEPFLLNFCVD